MDDASLFWWLYVPFGAAVAAVGIATAAAPGWTIRGALLTIVGLTNLAVATRGAYRNARHDGYEPGPPTAFAFGAIVVTLLAFALTAG